MNEVHELRAACYFFRASVRQAALAGILAAMSSFMATRPRLSTPNTTTSGQDVTDDFNSVRGPQDSGPGLKTVGGVGMVSSGCNDLDRLCGGGIPLGCLVIVSQVCYKTIRGMFRPWMPERGL